MGAPDEPEWAEVQQRWVHWSFNSTFKKAFGDTQSTFLAQLWFDFTTKKSLGAQEEIWDYVFFDFTFKKSLGVHEGHKH